MLVHGFSATAAEMQPLGDALGAAGHAVHGVELPGHGTRPADLEQVGRAEWLAAVLSAVDAMAQPGRRVAVVGMSMGALLALRAAVERPDAVGALVLCGPALALRNPLVALVPWIARVPGVRRRWPLVPRGGVRGISDPAARAASPTYDGVPWRAVAELLALKRAGWSALPRVRQPTLVLHGRLDRSVPLRVIGHVRRRIGTPWLEAHVLDRSWHVVTMDVERMRVAALVCDFLRRLEAADAPA